MSQFPFFNQEDRTASRTLESSIEEDWPQPFKVTIRRSYNNIELYEWCSERFGRHTEQWNNPRWSTNTGYNTFWFKKEKDRTMFLMRWA
jgi:hypothetical protein